MPAREVLLFPHPALKRRARRLGPAGRAEAERVAADLVDTMATHPGCVGLAAPQLDELVRVVAVDVSEHPKAETSNGLLLLVDPEVVSESGAEVARVGCLSVPHLTANVRRATAIELPARRPASPSSSPARASRRAACSTRSTTSTACCSSTASTRWPPTSSGESATGRGLPLRRSAEAPAG